MSGLFEELKRRNVFKVRTAYVVLAWLLAQVTDVFSELEGDPEYEAIQVRMIEHLEAERATLGLDTATA